MIIINNNKIIFCNCRLGCKRKYLCVYIYIYIINFFFRTSSPATVDICKSNSCRLSFTHTYWRFIGCAMSNTHLFLDTAAIFTILMSEHHGIYILIYLILVV